MMSTVEREEAACREAACREALHEITDCHRIAEEREMNLMVASDLYKELTGVRPPYYLHKDMSDEELKVEITNLQIRVDDMMRREEAREVKLVEKFNSVVDSVISNGASDRATALRWMMQGANSTIDQLCDVDMWLLEEYGIFGVSKEGCDILRECKQIFKKR